MNNEKQFTLKEVEQLVKNAYNVGFCDGLEGGEDPEFRDYIDEDDFWDKNISDWINEPIKYYTKL
jgi:hypothetical protein